MILTEQESQLADKAFEEARGWNVNYWTIDKNDPEVRFWKKVWVMGYRAAKKELVNESGEDR